MNGTVLPFAFPAPPVGPELLGLLVVCIALLYGLLGRWVYRDAKARGSDWAWQWAIGIPTMFVLGLVPGLLLVIVYLLLREDETEPTHRTDRTGA